MRKIEVQSQPGQIVCKTLLRKKTHHKKRDGGVAQGVDPEFKSQYLKKKNQKNSRLFQWNSWGVANKVSPPTLYKKNFVTLVTKCQEICR
jgi:hypothetical protein